MSAACTVCLKLLAADDMLAVVVDTKTVGHAMIRNRNDLLLMLLSPFYLHWKHVCQGTHTRRFTMSTCQCSLPVSDPTMLCKPSGPYLGVVSCQDSDKWTARHTTLQHYEPKGRSYILDIRPWRATQVTPQVPYLIPFQTHKNSIEAPHIPQKCTTQ